MEKEDIKTIEKIAKLYVHETNEKITPQDAIICLNKFFQIKKRKS